MKILLHHHYSGRLTNEQLMLAGEHDVKPYIGKYLVEKGHATDITPTPKVVIEEPPTEKPKRTPRKKNSETV